MAVGLHGVILFSTVTLVGWIGDAFSLQQALLITPVFAVAYWWQYRSLALRIA